jgi:hypothetical protein
VPEKQDRLRGQETGGQRQQSQGALAQSKKLDRKADRESDFQEFQGVRRYQNCRGGSDAALSVTPNSLEVYGHAVEI